MAHLRPPPQSRVGTRPEAGGRGLLPLHQQVWATAGWIFGVHYPRGAQDGEGRGWSHHQGLNNGGALHGYPPRVM